MRHLLLAACLLAPSFATAEIHDSWDAVLRNYSKDGWVDYARLKKNRARFDDYVQSLRETAPAAEKKLPRAARLAFWINAYNALAVKTILDHYPIKKGWGFAALAYPENSIKQIKGAFDGIKHEVAGRRLTLDELENKILRGELDEPRIHFAIVCASIGCPMLRAEAYRAETLDAQLEDALRAFLNSDRIRIDPAKKEIALSKIFKWFQEDFRRFDRGAYAKQSEAARGPLEFFGERLDAKTRAALARSAFSLSWQAYDWGLNDKRIK